MKIVATNYLTSVRTLAIVIIGLVTLTGYSQNTQNSEMMHHNSSSYYWGMHMGWWLFALLVVIIGIVVLMNFKKRK